MRERGFGFRVSGFGLRVSGFGFRDSGFGSRDSGIRFRVSGPHNLQELGLENLDFRLERLQLLPHVRHLRGMMVN